MFYNVKINIANYINFTFNSNIMVMNKRLQISKLKKLAGSDADKFDFDAQVDGRLHYSENLKTIKAKLSRRGLLKKQFKKPAIRSSTLVLKAMSINSKRKKFNRALDGSKKAKRTYDARTLNRKQFVKWKKNKDKYDIEGVDSVGTYFKKQKVTKKQAKRFLADIDFDDDLI